MADRMKRSLSGRIRFRVDADDPSLPRLIPEDAYLSALDQTARKPFRMQAYYDPSVWGGQWMKHVFGLDPEVPNYGWSFDGVPEENALCFRFGTDTITFPAINLVHARPLPLLGEHVYRRFGAEFPIRFDFLDTMGGGNLSLQVHPTNEFAHREFGLHYTQDESYYLLDAGEDAVVYLGLREGIDKHQMIADLRAAQRGEMAFPAEQYVNVFPARKHDHYLIPAGTIHCSGHDSMVLEISTTPSIFTFKLWDWNRLGLDGKPRPINVERGRQVIQWNRTTGWVNQHIRNHFEVLSQQEGIMEERTGLHPNEFIETHRTSFSVPVTAWTQDSVHVLNLVEGEEAVVESPDGRFEPFVVHYAETFIIPACVGEYTIRPTGNEECMVIRAFIRFNP